MYIMSLLQTLAQQMVFATVFSEELNTSEF